TGFLGDFLAKTPQNSLVTDQSLATSRPGIFAAGDVRDTDLRQVVTAAADGARAAINAYHYLVAP
ncbi:MAG: FAD-dependent oxidoreductase, partial [Candidatus Adiutrix sp.]